MLAGRIDEFDRALLFVSIRATQSAASQSLEVWIDTGFTGDLVVSKELGIQLGLPQSAMVAAALADGSKSILETFSCVVDWFGQSYEVEVIIENPIRGISTIGNVKDPSPPTNWHAVHGMPTRRSQENAI